MEQVDKVVQLARKRRAIAASWMTSPAFTPTIETPRTSFVSTSATILMAALATGQIRSEAREDLLPPVAVVLALHS